jgi:hypothetical protein
VSEEKENGGPRWEYVPRSGRTPVPQRDSPGLDGEKSLAGMAWRGVWVMSMGNGCKR